MQSQHNLADGHAHQTPCAEQQAVIHRLPQIFANATAARQQAVEQLFCETFLRSHGQELSVASNCTIYYSASIAIHVAARVLQTCRRPVGLISPTFDNIHDLLLAQGIEAQPIAEMEVATPQFMAGIFRFGAVFLVLPNNPTGFSISQAALFQLAQAAAASDVLLIIDQSFRYFQRDAPDTYEILKLAGCRFIGIEDTGKFLSAADVKAGFIVADADTHRLVRRISEDILLNVSPFQLQFLTELLEADDRQATLNLVELNRTRLREACYRMKLTPEGLLPSMSVEWLKCRSTTTTAGVIQSTLESNGVVVLPGEPFYWNNPADGIGYLRIALMRDKDTFDEAISAALTILAETTPLKEEWS